VKAFWFTYVFATVALLVFCCWRLFGFQPVLCSMSFGGVALSAILLARNRHVLARQRYLIPVAVVAGFASVAVGFIGILLVAAAGSFLK